jgi:hypothetical protein
MAGLVALVYAVLVVAMSAMQLAGGLTLLAYAAVAILAPIAVVLSDRMAQSSNRTAEAVAQLGLGVIAGMWALPATSGLVAILAVVAGARSVFLTGASRWSALLALVTGAVVGVGVLALSFSR